MATVWRVLKWMLLAWATVSLLGIATLFGIAWWSYGQYEDDAVAAETPPTPEQRARELVEGIWPDQHAFVALAGRHVVANGGGRPLVVTAVRVQPSTPKPLAPGEVRMASMTSPSQWSPGDRVEPVTRATLELVASRLSAPMQSSQPAWMPSAAQLRGGTMRVEVRQLSVSSGSLDSLTLYALRPADNTLFVFQQDWTAE